MNIRHTFIVLSFFLLSACEKKLDSNSLPVNAHFTMTDNLMCIAKAASDSKEIGKRITLIGLTTTHPKVKYESGLTSPMQKVFESKSTLTIQLIASSSGSVDSFVIDKTKGHFSRAMVGSFAGVYSSASVGICQ